MSEVSQYRIEKRRTAAALTLTTGATVRGCFFLASGRASHNGPERVADLLNAEGGFFPFEMTGAAPRADRAGLEPRGEGSYTVLYNRSQVVVVTLLENTVEAQLDPGYDVATEREVRMLLSNGETVEGRVRVYRPSGRDRLSDYARVPDAFRYVETDDATFIVNSAHIVELREIGGS